MASRTTLDRTTNIAGNRVIRGMNRIASRGRRELDTRAADGATSMGRGAMIVAAAVVAVAVYIRAPAEPVGAVRALSVSGR